MEYIYDTFIFYFIFGVVRKSWYMKEKEWNVGNSLREAERHEASLLGLSTWMLVRHSVWNSKKKSHSILRVKQW